MSEWQKSDKSNLSSPSAANTVLLNLSFLNLLFQNYIHIPPDKESATVQIVILLYSFHYCIPTYYIISKQPELTGYWLSQNPLSNYQPAKLFHQNSQIAIS